MKLKSIRREFKYAALDEQQIPENPMQTFSDWMTKAISSKVIDPTAMSVSTIGIDGYPQSRIVLLKDYNEDGFVFFTNYESDKGNALENNSVISLLIYWPDLDRQIRITGHAEKTSSTNSDLYFQSRPLLSQAAAIVSNQSKKIESRDELEKRFNDLINNMPEKHFDRPKNWGGYLVKPIRIEFWQGRENRLHDRILYEKINNKWEKSRLSP